MIASLMLFKINDTDPIDSLHSICWRIEISISFCRTLAYSALHIAQRRSVRLGLINSIDGLRTSAHPIALKALPKQRVRLVLNSCGYGFLAATDKIRKDIFL